MLIIRTDCPYCGEVDLKPEAIELWVVWDGREGEYCFICPLHGGSVTKRVDRKIVILLASAGVEVHELGPLDPAISIPVPSSRELEPSAWRERHADGPPLTIDDVIEFGFQIEPITDGREIAAAAADPYR